MSTKRTIRGLLDRSAVMAGITQWCETRMHRGLTVLMYHRVLPDAEALRYPFRSLAMPESAFATQVRWLAENCTVLPMRECVERLHDDVQPARPLVAVTFDDGYLDNATIAAPLLEEAGLRGTFFVTTGFLATGEPLWFDRFALAYRALDSKALAAIVQAQSSTDTTEFQTLADWMAFAKSRSAPERDALLLRLVHAAKVDENDSSLAPMSLEQLRTLHARGHEIGGHTVSHPLLPDCDDNTLASELVDSKQTLELWLDTRVSGLAYPNGNHDERVLAATQRAGYDYACTTSPGINLKSTGPLQFARLDLTRDRVFDSKGEFNTLAFRSEVCRVRRFMRAG